MSQFDGIWALARFVAALLIACAFAAVVAFYLVNELDVDGGDERLGALCSSSEMATAIDLRLISGLQVSSYRRTEYPR